MNSSNNEEIKKMAKSKEEINKSQAIREALKANKDKTPTEIAALLSAKGVEVNAQYVSTIKSNMRSTKLAVRKMRKGLRRAGRKSKLGGSPTDNGFTVVNAAIELVKVAGGIEEARSVIDTVEKLGKALQ
jgi:arginine repressor